MNIEAAAALIETTARLFRVYWGDDRHAMVSTLLPAALELHYASIDGHLTPHKMDRLSEKLPMPAGYVDLVLRHLGTTAAAAGTLLEGTDVSLANLAEPEAEMTLGQLLRAGSLTVAELAYRLGYEDSANFSRACRRWFGSAPGGLRQKRVNPTAGLA